VFAVAAAQISLLINTTWAASLAAGSVSALQYADRLMEFPIGLLGVALGTVLLPSLSKANSEGDTAEYSSLLDWGLRLTLLLALPAAVGMATLAEPLIATLFHYGKFTSAAIHSSAMPLMAYAAGLLGIILVKTLAPAFYARQDIRTPVRIATGTIIATQLLNIVFVWWMGMGVTGLALSIGAGACLNSLFLYIGLRKRKIFVPQPGWVGFSVRLVVAVCLMGAVAWFAQVQINWAAMQAHAWLRAGALFLIIGVSAVVYFAVLFVLGFRLGDFKRRAR
jgi:putative peptidoglycan lipid II flippase